MQKFMCFFFVEKFWLFRLLHSLMGKILQGDLVASVKAEDGDAMKPGRSIRYGFLAENSPFVHFFKLDPLTGIIKL